MEIVFTSLAYPELSLEDVVERVSRFGFDGLELRVADDGKHLKPEFPINRKALEILSSIKISDLAGYTRFHFSDESERKRNEKALETLIKMANSLNALGVRVYGGEFSEKSAIHRIAESLNRMNRIAEDYSVKILIETHDSLAKKDNIVKLLQELEEDIGFVYDPANVIYRQWCFTKLFHLKDIILVLSKRD
ncbi:Hypothetical protein SSO3034 [Saccharolobus solfataricus P2]|uniref:Xylose isomerase-like TIM barrel domain-containing protein n=2 Tax=Saccharolobus solfataricus TaxID=2287 RepID=Q97UI3_SACS2|nr:TIM barrel protein [Saccharolobus solfataricus]AAK43136.1 Hypothetical protein SSO3034 [Saccharolobus solfataricus P2]AKA73179.1 sugar phosphate isomerase/epimerase [Saccharolobus solfataricus]AKA75877.1 sugar phosphate isomerase/epimerase [Saccharolobus solfataricus]AKA78569.1 sugar phosphate isomerase/epimerase [Saccharolobus solfataricus]